ncbi:MAG: C1 family peptidase [Candidatus Woesearchaeota archaeon]
MSNIKHNIRYNKIIFVYVLIFIIIVSPVVSNKSQETVTLIMGNTEVTKLADSNKILFESSDSQNKVDLLNQIIREKNLSWVANHTSVSDLPDNEKKYLSSAIIEIPESEITKDPSLILLGFPSYSYPEFIDWRNHNNQNWVTPVKDQTGCGSCWAFAVAGILESHINIQLNNSNYDADLSEQHIISCSSAGNCDYGGSPSGTLNYTNATGIIKESCFPYTATNNVCSNACVGWQNHTLKTSYIKIASNSEAIKEAISIYGPIQITYFVDADFGYYEGGIYTHTILSWTGNLHAVDIVGYNDSGEYWILKNSWGEDWGEEGYFKISYSENTLYSSSESDPRILYMDLAYAVISTNIDTPPNISNAQSNVSISKSSEMINFTVEIQPKSIKNLTSVKINNLSMTGSLSNGGIFTLVTNLSSLNCESQESTCNISINATDDAGISTTIQMQEIILDNIAPTASINSPLNGYYFNSTSLVLSGTASDGIEINSVWIIIDEDEPIQVIGNETWTYNWSNISLGEHDISVYAIDTAGNIGNASNNIKFYYINNNTLAPPEINGIFFLENDYFYSYNPQDNIINLIINTTSKDGSEINISASYANFSNITSNCGLGNSIINFSVNSGYLVAECNLSNIILQERFVIGKIAITVVSDRGNIAKVNSSSIIFHNMSYPTTNSSDCIRFAEGTTNFSSELDFNNVNLSLIIMLNGSSNCNNGAVLPWNNSFRTVANISFMELNLTKEDIITKISELKNNIVISAFRPRTFGNYRLYINTTAFSELNSDATITLYDLAFSSVPKILEDTNTIIEENTWSSFYEPALFNASIGNITFITNGVYGYNITDITPPTIRIYNPENNFSSSNIIWLNFTINGTGSEVSRVVIRIINNSESVINRTYNISNHALDNSANCEEESNRSELTRCIINLTLGEEINKFKEGIYNINISGSDFGNQLGNEIVATRRIILDNTTPVINILSPLNNTNVTSGNISYVLNITDVSELVSCKLFIDGTNIINWTNIILNESNVTVNFPNELSNETHLWYINCSDQNNFSTTTENYLFNVNDSVSNNFQYIDSCRALSLPGKYKLNTSINSSSANSCISITTPDVTLDCNGYSLTGNITQIGYNAGVIINASNAVVKNCIIKDFYYQIRFLNNNTVNATITNNTFSNARESNATSLLYSNSASNNYIYLNNFSNTNGEYIRDNTYSYVDINHYNYTINGLLVGNIYENVINGSVLIEGSVESPIPGLYIGNGGTDYPYSAQTSKGKIAATVNGVLLPLRAIDYAPLTPNQEYYYSCTGLESPNTIYLMNTTSISQDICFNILADNITLDCGGNLILGRDWGNSYGVYSERFNTTIKNCNIYNFSKGIFFNNADNGTIINTTINSSVNGSYGIHISNNANYNRISNINITINGFSGIRIQESSNNTISDSKIISKYQGILISEGKSNNLIRINITSLDSSAIRLDHSYDNNISNSKLFSNSYYGLALYQSANNTISNSNINSTAVYGLQFSSSIDNILENNTFDDNIMFYELSSCNNIFLNNKKTENKSALIYINQANLFIANLNNVGQIIFCNINNSTISNINISLNKSDCLSFYNSSNNIINNLNISCSNSVYFSNSLNTNISNSNIFAEEGYALNLYKSNNTKIDNITINTTYAIGILSSGTNNNITNSNIYSEYSNAIYIDGTINNHINNATATSLYDNAVYFTTAGYSTISNSNIMSIRGYGISLVWECTYVNITNNNITSGLEGCTFDDTCKASIGDDGYNNIIINNTIKGEYWIKYDGWWGENTFSNAVQGNKYILLNGTYAASFCNITSNNSDWANSGSDRPFNSVTPCLQFGSGNSRWMGSGNDYRPYVLESEPNNTQPNTTQPIITNQTFYVNENSDEGTLIGIINASDEDPNQSLTFEILIGNEDTLFRINESSGELFVNREELNYESINLFTLTIIVTDNETTPLSANATITIRLNNLAEGGGGGGGGGNPNYTPNITIINNLSNQNNSYNNTNISNNYTENVNHTNVENNNGEEDNTGIDVNDSYELQNNSAEINNLGSNSINNSRSNNITGIIKESIKKTFNTIGKYKIASVIGVILIILCILIIIKNNKKEILLNKKQKDELLEDLKKLSDELKKIDNTKLLVEAFQKLLKLNKQYIVYAIKIDSNAINIKNNMNIIKNKSLYSAITLFIKRHYEMVQWKEKNITKGLIDYYIQELRQLIINTSKINSEDQSFDVNFINSNKKCEFLLYDAMIFLEYSKINEAKENYRQISEIYKTLPQEERLKIVLEADKLYHYIKYIEIFNK